MTVLELIEILLKLDPSMEVRVYNGEWETYNSLQRTEVIDDFIILYD